MSFQGKEFSLEVLDFITKSFYFLVSHCISFLLLIYLSSQLLVDSLQFPGVTGKFTQSRDFLMKSFDLSSLVFNFLPANGQGSL